MNVRFAALPIFLACATTPATAPAPTPEAAVRAIEPPSPAPREEILSTGGDPLPIPPPATVEITDAEVIAWSMTEVPADSRLQAALAMVDALARAELQRSISVGVASLELDVQRDDAQHVARMTAEVTQGVLPGLDPPRHAWQKVRRGGETVLRLVARLRAGRAQVEQAIAAALSQGDRAALAREAVLRMAGALP